jgi:adenine-specific DNA methylase
LTRSLHDYFLVKSVDKVRPGGLIALITSFYSMDKRHAAVRRHLAERATLIAAYRLPNTAFLANAGTKVTTDVLFLRKN